MGDFFSSAMTSARSCLIVWRDYYTFLAPLPFLQHCYRTVGEDTSPPVLQALQEGLGPLLCRVLRDVLEGVLLQSLALLRRHRQRLMDGVGLGARVFADVAEASGFRVLLFFFFLGGGGAPRFLRREME